MAILRVKNRDFQRATGAWLRKARQGNKVVILAEKGPPLTLEAGAPASEKKPDWNSHFDWLKTQPEIKENPVDILRREEDR